MALIVLIAFLITFLYLSISLDNPGLRDIFLASSIFFGALIAIMVEGLSIFNTLNRSSVLLFWGLFSLGMLGLLIWTINKKRSTSLLPLNLHLEKSFFGSIRQLNLKGKKFPELIIFIIIVLIVGLLLVTAWIAPPNTNDSIFYHMSRVMNWAQNESLNHYTTPINRQLWMPPWAEYAVLNLFLLSGSDHLSNLVQWYAMLGSLVGVSLIAKILGARRGGQIFAALFCLSINMGILQSTSTQTDYVTAYWVVCLAYLTVDVHKDGLFNYGDSLASPKWLTPILLSITVGLGVLTKGTFVAFALPFLVWLLISILHHHHWRRVLQLSILGIVIGVTLNAGVWWRNYQTYQSPLGPASGFHINETITPGVLVSNLIRNSTLHLGTPFGIINGPIRESVEWIHRQIGMNVDDPRTTIGEYLVKFSRHEDYAGNPLHFFFIPFSIILTGFPILAGLRKNSGNKKQKLQTNNPQVDFPSFSTFKGDSLTTGLYILVVITTFALFSLFFKWQATGSRLQLPFFVLCSPIAGLAFTRIKVSWAKNFLIGIFILASIPSVFTNPSRSLISFRNSPSIFRTSRTELLFANSPEFMPGYLSIIEAVRDTSCNNVGLKIDSHHPDYPFWALLSPSASETHFEYYVDTLEKENFTANNFSPCAVICTICNSPHWDGLYLDSTHFGGYSLYLDSN